MLGLGLVQVRMYVNVKRRGPTEDTSSWAVSNNKAVLLRLL